MSRRAAARLLLHTALSSGTITTTTTLVTAAAPRAPSAGACQQQVQRRGMMMLAASSAPARARPAIGGSAARRPLLRLPGAAAAAAASPSPSSPSPASSHPPRLPTHPPPSPALLLAAARVAAARHALVTLPPRSRSAAGPLSPAAAAAAAGAGGSSASGSPSPSSSPPTAQALFGTTDDDEEEGGGSPVVVVGDDGEPASGLRRDSESVVVAAVGSAEAFASAAAAAANAAAPAGSSRAYSTVLGGGGHSSNGSTRPPSSADAAASRAPSAASTPPLSPVRGEDGEQADAPPGPSSSSSSGSQGQGQDDDNDNSELHAVNTAIRANALIFLAKLTVAVGSSSAAMFAEAVHSLVDVANQTLLRVGILKARRAPTEAHPLGFARDAFIWPLISAVGIFCLGAGVSFVHGVAGFFEPAREIGDLTASYAVLAVSFALESHSLVVALRTLQSRAARHGMGLLAYLKTGADPAATAVMMEDGAAVAGLLIAGGCLGLCQLTGSALWDSAGSVAVSVLLGAVAASLIQRNRLFLIGKAMPNDQERRVIGYLESDPVIRRVRNARSEELGVRAYRFYGEIAFDGGEMARRCLDRVGRRRLFGALAAAAAARDAGRMDALMTAYSAAVVSATGAEVDRLERQISALVPGIKHVDLETDREAAGPRSGSRRRRREQMAAAAVAAAAGVGARGAVGAGAGAGAGAAGDGAESGQDDEVYGGAQLLFGDALDWDGGGSSGSSTKAATPARDADADAEAAAAAAWLEQQLPPDGSTAARRARPSLSAEAYREQELQAERASEQFLMEKQREERML